jgi:glycosyltransferase involved in cell wall biosynthesis
VKDKLPEVKVQLGLPVEKKIVLFSGKYIEKKRPLDLLKAFSALDPAKYFLVMAGDGQLRSEMEHFIEAKNIKNVLLTGFVNQSQIPLYYAAADVFVMCSGTGETWGLSVNEAMNFSKPVIVSATCGSSEDLVHEGENGFVFEEGNIDQLVTYLKKVLEDDVFRERAGRKSAEIINSYSIEKIVQNIYAELRSC